MNVSKQLMQGKRFYAFGGEVVPVLRVEFWITYDGNHFTQWLDEAYHTPYHVMARTTTNGVATEKSEWFETLREASGFMRSCNAVLGCLSARSIGMSNWQPL
jgi:hypothetical protein